MTTAVTYGPRLLCQFITVDDTAEAADKLRQVLRRDVAVWQGCFKYS